MKYLNYFKRALFALLFMCSSSTWAHDFVVDGIYYKILSEEDKTVEVTYKGTTCHQYSNEYGGDIVVPNKVEYEGKTYNVINIANNAFSKCTEVTSVIINSITVSSDAFRGCEGINNITIGNNVNEINNNAFADCTSLENIYILDGSNELILGYSYYEGSSQKYGLFYNSPLKTVYVGRNLSYETTLGGDDARSPFSNRTSLKSVTFGNMVTKIGNYFFYGCSGLAKITIPSNITRIGSYVFNKCTSLYDVQIEDGLETLNVGFNSEVYNRGLFHNCPLNTVYLGRNLTYTTQYGSPFQNNINIKNVTIGNKVTNINGAMFRGCTGLLSIRLSYNISEIGYSAFQECLALEGIYFESNPIIRGNTIPSTVTRHLILDDSNMPDFNIANANTYTDVSYTRTISEGKYGTIMLPFTPDKASLENYAFYTLKEVGDGYIRFEEVAAPEANTPYLYTLRAGGENTAITGGETTIAADINNGTQDSWELVGSFTKQTIDCTTGNYYAYSAARNEINRITKTLTVRPFRAYLTSTAAQNSNLRVFIGGTTGVTEISPDDIEGFDGGAVYDLYGRLVNEPAKGGIYIIDGKKVVL